MATDRHAEVTWNGSLLEGSGRIDSSTSGVLDSRPLTWKARAEDGPAGTSPEDLIAAAHAGCFAMALSAELGKANLTAESLRVTATVSLEKDAAGWSITESNLELVARVPNASPDAFRAAADSAKANCPLSKLLKAKITLDARLENA